MFRFLWTRTGIFESFGSGTGISVLLRIPAGLSGSGPTPPPPDIWDAENLTFSVQEYEACFVVNYYPITLFHIPKVFIWFASSFDKNWQKECKPEYKTTVVNKETKVFIFWNIGAMMGRFNGR